MPLASFLHKASLPQASLTRATLLALLLIQPPAHPQQPSMPGMDMPPTQPTAAPASMSMSAPRRLIDTILQHTSSGTSVEPPSTPMPMWMSNPAHTAGWTLMLHGEAFLADIQQYATQRGGDKLFSTNWIMPMASRPLGPGRLTLRTMLSLEPATISDGRYPELFQQGETADNRPIVDGQHPHDFLMEFAALYDLHLSPNTLLSLYAAPVGDPALGPTAYPHRHSASEDPIAALGHHQQDSTHIAFNVLTLGLTHGPLRLEASGFHGAEPTEARWHFQPSPNGLAPDSYSTRLTFTPTEGLSAQYSIAHLTSPEALYPGDDQRRQTASLMLNRPLGIHHDTTSMPGMDMSTPATANWSTTLLWGQAHSLRDNTSANSYLLESLLNFRIRNNVWTRIELAARTSELLDGTTTQLPAGVNPPELPVGHVQAYTVGYDHDLHLGPHLLAAPGAQFTLYRTPDPLLSTYGRNPFSAVAFVRLRLTQ